MKDLAAALVEAQNTMPAVKKTGRNPHFNSLFVTLDHLIAKTKPHLAKHGLTITQQLDHVDGNPALTTSLIHTSGESLTSTLPLPAVVDMQKFGAAVTYARRYAWASLLGISDEDDDDGNNAVLDSGARSSSPAPDAQQATGGSARTGAGSAGTAGPASNSSPGALNGDWTWPSGKNQGKSLAETDRSYIEWYAEKGPKADVRAMCSQFLTGGLEAELADTFDAALVGADDDIPF